MRELENSKTRKLCLRDRAKNRNIDVGPYVVVANSARAE
jgi:hypothetical protein